MRDYLAVANSPLMMILCGIVILFVFMQSILFMCRAWRSAWTGR